MQIIFTKRLYNSHPGALWSIMNSFFLDFIDSIIKVQYDNMSI